MHCTERATSKPSMELCAWRIICLMFRTPKPDQMLCRVTGKGYMDVNRISGYIPGKMVFFLMQVTLDCSLHVLLASVISSESLMSQLKALLLVIGKFHQVQLKGDLLHCRSARLV